MGSGAARLLPGAPPAAPGRLTPRISVRVRQAGSVYTAEVDVDEDGEVTHHLVHFAQADLDRWGRRRSPEDLIQRSFEFLLQRESKESILREFNLSVIPRYFPDYDQAMTVPE